MQVLHSKAAQTFKTHDLCSNISKFPQKIYLSRNTIDMKLHHVFTTWIIFWFSFLILRVNYTINRKKKKGGNNDINDLAVPTLKIIKVGLT